MNFKNYRLISAFILSTSSFAQAELALIDDQDLSDISGQANLNSMMLDDLGANQDLSNISLKSLQENTMFQGLPTEVQDYVTNNFDQLQNMSVDERMNTMASQMNFENLSSTDRFQNMSSDQQSFIEANFDDLKGMSMSERMETMQAQGFEPPAGMSNMMQNRQ